MKYEVSRLKVFLVITLQESVDRDWWTKWLLQDLGIFNGGAQIWHDVKGLVIGNIHVKYESYISYSLIVQCNVQG